MQKKKFVIITLIILLCLLIGFIIFKNKPKKTNEPNNLTQNNINNEKVLNDSNIIKIPGEKSINNFEFTDIKLERVNADEYEFTAIIKNIGNEIVESNNLDIKLFNSNNEVIGIVGAITKPLLPSEEGILKTYILNDVKDAKDVEITFFN